MKITLTLHISRDKKDEPQPERQHEPQPEGNNFAHIESSGQYTAHQLDADERPGNYGNRISMRWTDPQR